MWLQGWQAGDGQSFHSAPYEKNKGEKEATCGWVMGDDLLSGEGCQLMSLGSRRKAFSLLSDLNLWYWCIDLEARRGTEATGPEVSVCPGVVGDSGWGLAEGVGSWQCSSYRPIGTGGLLTARGPGKLFLGSKGDFHLSISVLLPLVAKFCSLFILLVHINCTQHL